MYVKSTLPHTLNYERKIFGQKKQFEKCNKTSFNLEKTLEYLKIQESLRSENLTEYYSCKGIFSYFSLYTERYINSTK